MATLWEIDPTDPDGDRDGAGAEGGAMSGDSAGDTTLPPPLQPPQEVDRTNPFKPTGGTSTPYPPPDDTGENIELSNMTVDEMVSQLSEELNSDDIPAPVTEVDYIDLNEKEKHTNRLKKYIKDKFPHADFKKTRPSRFR